MPRLLAIVVIVVLVVGGLAALADVNTGQPVFGWTGKPPVAGLFIGSIVALSLLVYALSLMVFPRKG